MREQHKNPKTASQLRNYKPALDTLEDRSMPGNALIGLTGFSLPFSVTSGQKALSSQLAKATTSITKTTISTQTSQPLAATSSTAAFFAAGKQSQQIASPSSGSISIQGTTAATNMTFSSNSGDSFEAILNRTAGNAAAPTVVSPSFIGAISTNPTMAAASATTGGTGTGTGSSNSTSEPLPYDAVTRAHLKELANEGSADYRNLNDDLQLSPQSLAAAEVLKASMPNLQFREDGTTGLPKMIYNLSGTLTGPQAGTPANIAINYLNSIATFLGVQQSDINALTVNKAYGESFNTSKVKLNYVYLQQKVAGIPVLGMTNVSVLGDGKVVSVANGMQPNLLDMVNTTTPSISAKTAIERAAANLGLAVTKPITAIKAEAGATRAGSYSDGGFAREAITSDLALVPTNNGVRLAWHSIVVLKNSYNFEFYVDAVDGNVLLRNSLTFFDSYRVLPYPAKSPDQGAIATLTNPADKVASPYGWHDINGRAGADYFITRGNNTFAKTRRNSSLPPGSAGSQVIPSGGSTNTYSFVADFKKDPSTYQHASAVQLFYGTNAFHDVTYRYGFTEMAANYQQNNYGRGGVGNDQILGFAQDDADLGTTDNAFFSWLPEGRSGEVHMFVWDLTGPFRDGDFANEIVSHELGHGLQMRLIGGGNVLAYFGTQADAMNEGGSDYASLFFTTGLAQANNYNGRTPSGTWALGLPPNSKTPFGDFTGGIRRLPYSADFSINPLTYNDIDPNQIDVTFPIGFPFDFSQAPPDESHNAGEIWANTLWEMTANLVATDGFSSNLHTGTAGNNIAFQNWITGMKMTAALPTFLDQRDAIVTADLALFGGAHLPQIWAAFAKRGMGIFADDGGSSNSTDVIEDFTIPDDLPDPGNGGGGGDEEVGGDGSEDSLYEPNETSNKAFNLGTVTGEVTVDNLQIKQNLPKQAGDRDWFKFKPTKSGVLTLTMTPNTTAGDLDVRLYRSASGSPSALTEIGITQGTKRVAGAPETITVAVGAGITYYFNTSGFNKALGNYELSITAPE